MNEMRIGKLRPSRLVLPMFYAFSLMFVFTGNDALLAAPQEATQEPVKQQEAPAVRTPRQNVEMKADIMMARKQFSEAIEAYEELLKTEPKNAVLLNKVGVGYSSLTKLDKAKKYYERSIKANPKFASALNNLGTVHFYQKKFRRAIKTYERAIEQRPDSATFQGNLGHAYFADKKYPLAIAAWGHALELDPLVFEQRGTGGTILQTSSVEERATFYFYMAKTYASLNNAERCARFLKRAIDEGYKNIAAVEKDPAFAKVIKDPLVQEALQTPPPTPVSKPTI